MCRGKLAKSMDLLCSETVSEGSAGQIRQPANQPATQAIEDPVLMQQRVLDNLLRKEERHPTPCTYFGTVQREITPHMRRVVAEWMLEVCDEQDCQEEVFPLAMTYLDRFLGTCCIGKNQLQLLGTACLLVASKLREPTSRGLPAEMLVFYTDNSITLDNLCKWELLLLSKLKWNMSAVTPHDFLQLLVSRLPLRGLVDVEMVTRHAQTFIALAARDYEFTMYTASTLAAASVAAALQGLDWPARANVNPCDLLERLHSLTGVEQDYLQTCLEQIEAMVQKTIQETSNNNPNGQAAPQMACADWPLPQNADKCHDKAGTPTDVRDVHF